MQTDRQEGRRAHSLLTAPDYAYPSILPLVFLRRQSRHNVPHQLKKVVHVLCHVRCVEGQCSL